MRTRSSKGWGQLPREMARALARAKINGSESKVLWAMVYKTIAFNKSSDRIPWCQLEELTGIDQWHLGRAINSLLKKGLILKKDKEYGFHIDFDKEEIPPNRVVKKELPPDQGDLPPNQGDLPPNQVDSRDLSKRAYQEKGLLASKKKKQRKKFMEGLKGFRESIKQIPGKIKEDS